MRLIPPDNDEPDNLGSEGSRFEKFASRRWFIGRAVSTAGLLGASYYYWNGYPQPHLIFDGQYAHAGPELPPIVHLIVQYANELQASPYEKGGGHKLLFDDAFDCSGAVSHILYRAGLLRGPLSSEGFARYGIDGPGRFVTLFVRPREHVFMAVCGLRFDTSGGSKSEGPRWRAMPRDPVGFRTRHPADL